MKDFVLRNNLAFIPEKKTRPLMFAKKDYGPKVHRHGWQGYYETLPKDFNAYCPPGGSQLQSTYFRLGTCPSKEFTSSYQAMTEQIWRKAEYESIDPHKPKLNFFTYTRNLEKLAEDKEFRPTLAMDYISTMQRSFSSPHPKALRGVTRPKINPMLYRKTALDGTTACRFKFTDDDLIPGMQRIQELKKHLHRSFDPATSEYTDHCDNPRMQQRTCTPIQYAGSPE